MSMTTTKIDTGSVVLQEGSFRDDLVTFTAAGLLKPGTILARLTADGKLVPFVIGGSGGAEIPVAVLTYTVTANAAGDVPVRDMVSGKVRANRLVVHADGDGSNLTPAILDQLRDYSVVAIDVQELNIYDNS